MKKATFDTKAQQQKRKRVKLNFKEMKLFKSKRSIKKGSSSEFSEKYLINLCEVSDHSLEDVCQEPDVLAKDLEKGFSANELNINDFILVECKG